MMVEGGGKGLETRHSSLVDVKAQRLIWTNFKHYCNTKVKHFTISDLRI